MSVSINPLSVGIPSPRVDQPGGFVKLPMGFSYEAAAYSVSADGKTVVGFCSADGTSASPWVACYWPSIYGPPVIIGGDHPNSVCYAVNHDGSVIVGNDNTKPFIWTPTGGIGPFSVDFDFVHAMSPDARVVVGVTRVSIAPQLGQACYWDEARFRHSIPFLPGHNSSGCYGVSSTGRYIVGWSDNFTGAINHDLRAFRYDTQTTELLDLGIAPPGVESRGFGVSTDGSIVCGDQTVGGNGPFVWTPSTGIYVPPLFVPGAQASMVCMTPDGSMIVGYAQLPYEEFPDAQGQHFSYWTSAGLVIPYPIQMDPDDDWLSDAGNLTYASGVSADGNVVVGYTFGNPSRPWVYIMDQWAGKCVPPDPLNLTGPPVTPATVTPWILEPDWINGVTERLLWKTEVITSQTGIEQRRRLRNSPRRQIEAQFTLIGQDRQVYDSLMIGPAAHTWHYPLWWEKYRLTSRAAVDTSILYVEDMTGSEVTSGDVVLLQGASPFVSEIATISLVASGFLELQLPLTRDWPQGSHFYLTRLCRLTGSQRSRRRADNASQVTLTFDSVEPNDWASITPPDIGLDYPVLEITPNEADDMSFEYKRLVQEFDNQSASVPVRRDLAGASFMLQQFAYQTYGRRELADLRGLLYYLQGRLVPLYVPTYSRDVEMMSSFYAAAGTSRLAVIRSGYTDYVNAAARRLLMFVFRDGTTLIHTVASSTVVSDGQETLVMAEPFYRPISNAFVSRICWLALSRQDQDEIEILHHADSRGPTTMTTTFATIIDERNAQPYSVDVWNGSYVQDPTQPVPPEPDGPIPPVVIDPVPLAEGDVGGPFGGSENDGGPQGGDESQSAGFG